MPPKGWAKTHCVNGHLIAEAGRKTGGGCRVCSNIRTKAWRQTPEGKAKHARQQRNWTAKNPDKAKAIVRKTLYGMTQEQFDERLEKQNHRCAICFRLLDGTTRVATPVVDHVHDETERNRGILCPPCNCALGMFGDSTEVLGNAIIYLQRTQNVS